MPEARIQRCGLLCLEIQVWRDGVPDAKRLKDLEAENARLKRLLAESILDTKALKVALGRKR